VTELRKKAADAFKELTVTEKMSHINNLEDSRASYVFEENVNAFIAVQLIDDGNVLGKTKRIAKVKTEIDEATEIADQLTGAFDKAQKRLRDTTTSVETEAKNTSRKVRQIAADLQSALAKVEQQANFDRLERYVVLLERAASAMEILSEIDKTGKLKRIAEALK
jgi:septal ring factor EnvC (AmiA/AmiB activator)